MTNPLMKKLLMIAGMMLAAATAPVWAAEQAQPATDGKNPPATIAWGEAVDGVQVGLVPLGGNASWEPFFQCGRHARQRHISRTAPNAKTQRAQRNAEFDQAIRVHFLGVFAHRFFAQLSVLCVFMLKRSTSISNTWFGLRCLTRSQVFAQS